MKIGAHFPGGHMGISETSAGQVCGAIILFLLGSLGTAAFIWIAIHHNHTDHGPSVDVITIESGIDIPIDSFGDCNNITLTNWRLHRVGKTVSMGMQGTCITDGTRDALDLDVNFTNFPKRYRKPSPNGDTTDASGTGSVLVAGKSLVSVVEISGDDNEECVDIDVRFNAAYADEDEIEFSVLFLFQV
jgi:hypothetical protein